jgi:hypothetical protein
MHDGLGERKGNAAGRRRSGRLTRQKRIWVDMTYFINARRLCVVYCRRIPQPQHDLHYAESGHGDAAAKPGEFVWIRQWFAV